MTIWARIWSTFFPVILRLCVKITILALLITCQYLPSTTFNRHARFLILRRYGKFGAIWTSSIYIKFLLLTTWIRSTSSSIILSSTVWGTVFTISTPMNHLSRTASYFFTGLSSIWDFLVNWAVLTETFDSQDLSASTWISHTYLAIIRNMCIRGTS